jgi:RHS repeat-associated protein
VVERITYSAYGESTGSSLTRYGYTGREADSLTGLIYYRARWYDPQAGRFITEDPVGFAGGMNWYAYVDNNPIRFKDPLGLNPDGTDTSFKILAYLSQGSAGFGDTLTTIDARGLMQLAGPVGMLLSRFTPNYSFTLTSYIRQKMGVDCVVDPNATSYKVGVGLGIAHGLASLGAGIRGTLKAPANPKCLTCVDGTECFEAGTPIHTKDGTKNIEEIKEGDEVLSKDIETGKVEYKKVVKTFSRDTYGLLEVKIEGEDKALGVTTEHPFYARRARSSTQTGDEESEAEWIAAGELRVGDWVQRPSGEWVRVVSISRREGRVRVYNFEVEDNHNYYVGNIGTLVHNQCKTDRLKKHILNGEMDAARREAAGEVVARKADGTPWDHVTELRDAQRGLLNRIKAINKQLSNSNLDNATRSSLQDELGEASRLLDKTEGYLPR